MKNVLIMLAVATIPVAAGGCNCCGLGNLGSCPCNPCNWLNRGAYCGPTTPTYAAPVVSSPCPPAVTPASVMPQMMPQMMPQVMPQQYVMPSAAPYTAAPYSAAPMMAAPAQAAPYAYYAEPGCGYVEPGCGYMGNVGYGPTMPMEMGGMSGCCEAGSYDGGGMIGAPTEAFDPQPAGE